MDFGDFGFFIGDMFINVLGFRDMVCGGLIDLNKDRGKNDKMRRGKDKVIGILRRVK